MSTHIREVRILRALEGPSFLCQLWEHAAAQSLAIVIEEAVARGLIAWDKKSMFEHYEERAKRSSYQVWK